MSERRRLPNRRASESFAIQCNGLAFIATVSHFHDGCLGEIFLTNHKVGTDVDTSARDSAIVASIALQCGAELDTIRKALCRDGRGRAIGPLGVALDMLAAGEPTQ